MYAIETLGTDLAMERARHRRRADLRLLFRSAMVMLLLTELLGLTQVVHSPHSFLSFDPNRHSPFFAFAVAARFALHALFHGRQLHLAAAFVIGLILATLHAMVFFTTRQGWLSVVSTGLYYLGAGSFLILSWLAWRCRHSAQGASFVETLKAGMLLPLFVVTSWSWLEASYRLRTNTFDAVLYRFDDSLGFHASAIAGRLFAQTPGPWLRRSRSSASRTRVPAWLRW